MLINKWLHMQELNRDRELILYLPDDYATSGKHYPVLYLQDGQNVFFDDKAFGGVSWGFLDYVGRSGVEVIMVAIPCNYEPWMREAEYGAWKTSRPITILETGAPGEGLGGEGEAYVRWLKDELKPYMDSTYPTDSEDTAIVGSSAGGNISFYAAMRYPEVFKKCAALSCAFWYYPEQYVELVRQANLAPLQCLYLDLGTDEGNGHSKSFVNDLYKYDMDLILQELGHKEQSERMHFRLWEGATHSEAAWRQRVPVFMDLFYSAH